jgi:tetratricopeptide (TPR) repeat protein
MMRAVVVALAVLAWAAVATAQDSDAEARLLYERGDAAYVEGRYEAALAMFQEAYDLSQRPQLLYNLANTLERLGRTSEAIARLREFLPSAPDALRDTVEVRIASMSEREARRADEEAAAARAEAAAAEERDRQAREAVARAQAEAEEARRAADAAAAAHAAPTPAPPPGRDPPWGPITLYGVGAVAIGVGIALGVMTNDADARARAGCHTLEGVGTLCSSDVRSDLSQARDMALATDVVFAVSAAALAAAIVWTIIDATSEHGSTTEHATLHLVPWAGGLSLWGAM